MSILTDLVRLLDANDRCQTTECRECNESECPCDVLRDVLFPADGSTDTIRALLDVAEAGAGVITYIEKTVAEFERGYDSAFHTDTLGTTDWARTSMSFDMWEFIRLRKAIDSLVKEATDE